MNGRDLVVEAKKRVDPINSVSDGLSAATMLGIVQDKDLRDGAAKKCIEALLRRIAHLELYTEMMLGEVPPIPKGGYL